MNNNELKNREYEIRHSEKKNNTRTGICTLTFSLIALAAVIVINLLVGLIPDKYTCTDTTPNKLYTVADEAKDYLSSVDRDVKITLVNDGQIPREDLIDRFLYNFASCSKHIAYNVLDIEKDKEELSKYSGTKAETPDVYSIIVESDLRYKVISLNDLLMFYNPLIEQLAESQGAKIGAVPYEFYSANLYLYNLAEQNGEPTDTLFCASDALSKAVEYVTLDYIPHIYIVKGIGESNLPENFLNVIKENGVTFEYLRLDTAKEIPDDANCIVINAPDKDLSESQTAMIRKYLKSGGNMFVATSPSNVSHKNLLSLLSDYGMTAESGKICDEAAGHSQTSPDFLLPEAVPTHEIMSAAGKAAMLMPNAHGIVISDSDSIASVTPLFTTSDSAYILNGDKKESQGRHTVAAAASAMTKDGGDTRIVWFASSDALTDYVSAAVKYGNYKYTASSLLWMNETYRTSLPVIEGPSLSEPQLVQIDTGAKITWGTILVGGIPVIFLVAGIIIWAKRKKN